MIENLKKHARTIKIAAAVCCVLVCTIVIVGFATPETVTVEIDDSISTTSVTYETTARSVEKFFAEHDIDFVEGQDEMDVLLEDSIEDDMVFHIKKAFTVKVKADGKTVEETILPMKVKTLLKKLDIELDSNDIVEPGLDETLKKGDSVTVKRVTTKKVKNIVTEEYETYYQANPSMTIGTMEVTQEGSNGKIRETYKETYIDGELSDSELVKTKVLEETQNKIISYGTSIVFSKPAGLQYERKIEGVKAVSYYFEGNPSGAYGLPCTYGTVAVDPDVIPLGSKLYIEGYGYAIANDVGTSIKGNKIDLYMEKYEQCLIWGARTTTVYIIDEA